jgi:hypothetical protein
MSTIAFSCIHSERKNYSIRDAAPIALRTIRRFLERYPGKVKHVVLATQSAVEYSIYEDQMKLYFPRSKAEEDAACALLPDDTGNEVGETVSAERMIRIGTAPAPSGGATTSLQQPSIGLARDRARTALGGDATPAVGDGESDTKALANPVASAFGRVSVINGSSSLSAVDEGFSSMQGDVDARKREFLNSSEQEDAIIYSRYLRKSQTENFADIDALKVVYKCGPDIANRPTVALVGSRVPSETSWPRLLLYFIKIMEPIADKDYTLVYFHTNLTHKPDFSWMRKTYKVLPEKYKKNLKALYVIHPTWWLNVCVAFVRPFVNDRFWVKLHQINDLRQLYSYVPPQSISVPEEIVRYNQQLHGDVVQPEQSNEKRRPQDFL